MTNWYDREGKALERDWQHIETLLSDMEKQG